MKDQESERREMIARLERIGFMDPNCATCQEYYYPAQDPTSVFAPRHRAGLGCRSGGRPHCTCDGCF